MSGERVADIPEVNHAITEFEAAGESVAASYLYDWDVGEDLPGWDTPAERAAFWSTAIDFARSEGNPGMARIDTLCGHRTYAAAEPAASVESVADVTETSQPDPAASTTSTEPVPERHTTTTTTISYGEDVTGSGTFHDPLTGGDRAHFRFDTFEAWISTRLYPAGSGQELPTTVDHACVVLDYQAADGTQQVGAAELLHRIGLATSSGVELQRVDGFVQWPDDWMARLEDSNPVAWGNVVSRAICYFLPPEEPAEGFLVRVDDLFVEPWPDPGYVLVPTSTEDVGVVDVGVVCEDYSYDDELPISVCSTGLSVELAQERLGLDVDGFFGPGTRAAIEDFQASAGLAVNGVLDVDTWRLLGAGDGLPYDDINGDGVIDGSEIPFD